MSNERSTSGQNFSKIEPHLREKEPNETCLQVYMKLGPDMYHPSTFNIPKHEGVNEWAGRGTTKKTPENAMKLREF